MIVAEWPLLRLFDEAAGETGGCCRPPDGIEWLAIAITPRSGSTAFCSVLEKTGVLGRPQEILNPRGPADCILGVRRPASFEEYLKIVAADLGTGGLASFKAAWCDARPLAHSGRCEEFLTACRWVRLDRRDIESQAASLARARRTQRWHRRAGEEAESSATPLSTEEIRRETEYLHFERAGWAEFFAGRGLSPLELFYEDIVADVGTAVESVAALMGRRLTRRYDWRDSAYWKLA